MSALWVGLGVLGYVVCGVFGYGVTLHDFDEQYPEQQHVGISWCMAAIGPIGLLVSLMMAQKRGLRFRPQNAPPLRPWKRLRSWFLSPYFSGAFFVWSLGWDVHEIDVRRWPLGIAQSTCAVLFASLVIHLRRKVNGPRKAAEDNRSGSASNTGGSPGVYTIPSSGTITFTVGAGASTGVTRYAADLPRETATEPIQAWKVGRLGVSRSQRSVHLASWNAGYLHLVEGTAECRSGIWSLAFGGTKHRAPDPTCACGYYAWKSRTEAIEFIGEYGFALMQVELFGTVIEHERGYRAEKQRVLGVQIDQRCNGFFCRTPAAWVEFPVVPEGAASGEFHVWCDEHKPAAGRCITLAEVANSLQCEVRWADMKIGVQRELTP